MTALCNLVTDKALTSGRRAMRFFCNRSSWKKSEAGEEMPVATIM